MTSMWGDKRFGPRDDGDLLRLVEGSPFAWIVSGKGESFRASLMPVRPWKTSDGRIVQLASHFPRRNDQVELLKRDPEAHLLFLGPHDYISSSWVRNRTWTPTWNFASARIHVEVEFVEDPDILHSILEDLVNTLEAGRENAWRLDEMGERYERLVRGIVGFFAHVKSVEERYKLGQDEEPGNFADILQALESGGDAALVEWIRRFNPDRA